MHVPTPRSFWTAEAPVLGRRLVALNAVVVATLSLAFFVFPPVRALVNLSDQSLHEAGVPAVAWRFSERLVPRYAEWARARVQRGRGAASALDVSGTEWPLFGSLFFLWGVENLQQAWDTGDHRAGLEPRVFAREAIVAASELVIDPHHAEWVRRRWRRDDYLHHQNVFYRMLVIGALTSRQRLLADGAHLELLRDQVESLARELDQSPSGLLEDYPGETYPGDVLAALVCIQRADAVLGTDHRAFLARARRAFEGSTLARHGLPPFSADPSSGLPVSEPRGSGNSWVTLLAPELWPEDARTWFGAYDAHFWQERWTAAGYREFSAEVLRPEWFFEIDAGPVLAGHGIAATAFGVGAARRNGRFDRAFPLMTELLATSWELPNGVLAGPGLLSNAIDAPLLGEAAVLWLSTMPPAPGMPVTTGGRTPLFTFLVLLGPLALGLAHLLTLVRRVRAPPPLHWPRAQALLWGAVMAPGLCALALGSWRTGLGLLVFGILVPRQKR